MHKAQYNRLRLTVRIDPLGPMLIRSGKSGMDPTRPDLEWVRTRHAFGIHTVYLPGSSLKGVIRSQAERILTSLGRRCEDPFLPPAKNESELPDSVFKNSCAAARTFGSLKVGGRTRFADAYPWPLEASKAEAEDAAKKLASLRERTGIAIDRRSGATRKGALYNLEVVEEGSFYTEISLSNFQLWQLRLILFVLSDLDEGFARIGSGKSRGLGRVRCRVQDLAFDWICRGEAKQEVRGVGALCPAAEAERWGLVEPAKDLAKLPGDIASIENNGLYARLMIGTEKVPLLAEAMIDPAWNAFLKSPQMAGRASS
jgi:CRISPR-associated RAMP protein (TIGR02581 family)